MAAATTAVTRKIRLRNLRSSSSRGNSRLRVGSTNIKGGQATLVTSPADDANVRRDLARFIEDGKAVVEGTMQVVKGNLSANTLFAGGEVASFKLPEAAIVVTAVVVVATIATGVATGTAKVNTTTGAGAGGSSIGTVDLHTAGTTVLDGGNKFVDPANFVEITSSADSSGLVGTVTVYYIPVV